MCDVRWYLNIDVYGMGAREVIEGLVIPSNIHFLIGDRVKDIELVFCPLLCCEILDLAATI